MDSISMLKYAAEPIQEFGSEIVKELFPKQRKRPVRHEYPSVSIVDDGHPLGLGNPKILGTIFSHLELRDLVVLRRVNLRWNFIACEYLRQKLGPCRIPPSRLKNFIRLMKNSCCNPFSNYAIRVVDTNESLFGKFISDFKTDIFSLRMKLAGNEVPMLLRLLHQLPNLTNLHVIRLPEEISYLSREHISDEFWKYKNLQLLHLKSIIFEKENLGLPFIKDYDRYIVNILNSSPYLSQLQFVNWETTLSHIFTFYDIVNPKTFNGWNPQIQQKDLKPLFESGLKFKSIKLIIDEDESFLAPWLKGQNSSVTHLSIKYHNDDRPRNFPTSCYLSNILSLYLHRWRGPVEFSSLQTNFPNLNVLSLSSVILEDLDLLGNENLSSADKCLSLGVLILMPLEKSVGERALKDLAGIFPNVTQLFVQLSGNDPAHVIYREWPNLQVLFLDFKENVTDEAITGIPNESFEVIKNLQCGCVHIKYLNDGIRTTSIGDLKKLLILVIRCGKGLTSFSLLKGISILTQLQRLWLLPNPNEEFYYQWCLQAIADGLQNLEHIVIGKEAGYPEESLKYLIDRLPFIHLQFK